VDDFKDLTGRYPKLLMWYEDWNTDFSAAAMEVAYSRGAEAIVTWEPWLDDQSTTLDQIVNGSKDAYIADWAEAAKNYGKRIYLRPMHEMNGYWYPWSCRKSGTTNTPAKYREAFRHIHTIFQNAGATNVTSSFGARISKSSCPAPSPSAIPETGTRTG
jgi:beta-mannanase